LKLPPILACSLLALSFSAQGQNLNPMAPKPGSPAPPLTFNHLLQAPPDAKADWPSLHGKVVVLEFWATWCVPCIAEIPVLNSLQASLDPTKVQFVSVDDEDPAIVDKFLKKRPISGWLGFDTSSSVFERYGVNARPATIIIDPSGHIASTTAHPENLKRDQLLALADGKPVVFSEDSTPGSANPAAIAERTAILDKEFVVRPSIDAEKTIFSISLTPGDKGDGHFIQRGPGQMDLTNMDATTLLRFGAHIPKTRITTVGTLPDTPYNLHVDAPTAKPKQLAKAVELAVESGTGVHIEHRSSTTAVYLLTIKPEGKTSTTASPYPGMAYYNPKSQALQCMNATSDDLANALEQAFQLPVVNETNLTAKMTSTFPINPKDLAAVNEALSKEFGLILSPAQRPVDTVILTAESTNPTQ